MAIPTGRESDKFMLRLPDGMRDRIKVAADASGRSMNAEIVATLEEKYPEPEPNEFGGSWRVLCDYLDLVDSAKSDAERAEFIESANAAMQADPALSGFEIRAMKDFDGEDFAFFVAKPRE